MIGFWILILAAIFCVGLFAVLAWYFRLWLQAYSANARIGFLDLVFMSFRQVSPQAVVECKVMAVQSGLTKLATSAIEAQYLAGGDMRRVTLAVIAADRAGISLDWDTAAAIDLAGRDILEAVTMSIRPRVIICPDPEDAKSDVLYGVAKDGIQLKVSVRVTVRTNLTQLIGGATESTVIARVGQSVISAIGNCDHYHDALRDPALITRKVIAERLDCETAFAIVSVDIAEIDVGRNIGAILQTDQAKADCRVALAFAEERRAMAIAKAQEMRARYAKCVSRVIYAESQIPSALGKALREGNIHALGKAVFRPKTGSRLPGLALLATPGATAMPNSTNWGHDTSRRCD